MDREVINKIKLPARAYKIDGGSYGDKCVTSEYCGFKNTQCSLNGEWQHGWVIPERNVHPEFVTSSDGKSYSRRKYHTFYVARQDQVDYLKSTGYKRVFAIGLPILYLENQNIKRIPGSLLIMPAHSLPDTNEDWDVSSYVNYIKSLALNFTKICVCVHKSCLDKGNWADQFEKEGFEIIEGAEEKDANSLQRMAVLFSQFEYMTSNAFGSHIAYASYYGCKVSIAGPRLKFRREDFEDLTYYKNAPEILDIRENWYATQYIEHQYSQFYVTPYEAILNLEWAAWQLGKQCKKTPKELRKIFRWDLLSKIVNKSKQNLRLVYLVIMRLPAWTRSLGLIPGLVAQVQLWKANKTKTGMSRIWCGWNRRLVVRNGTSDIDVFAQHFLRREILDIDFPKKNISTILDLGANIGVSVEVFRQLFPKAKIVAVELEKANSKLCISNHSNDKNVKVINGAIWSKGGNVGFKDVGDGSWAFQVTEEQQDNSVPAFTYSDILKINNILSVDIMKMDIEGAEAEVLEASADDIFSTTAISIIEVHDWIDGIQERVSKIIERCKEKYSLDISHNGEFLIVKNMDLLNK